MEEPLTKDQIEAIREYVTAPPSSHIAQRLIATIDARDDEIAQLRADLTRMNRALADERAAVVVAHERIAEVTAERDNARSRVVEQIKKSLPHAMQNAKAVYKYDVNESRARAMAVLIVDEAIQCLHFDDTRESIRAHAAGSGKGGS